ncbi:MAG: hypothetical protein Q7I94_02195 [Candidatus Contubernalis sp.]|nr:hypothetical protein [Candidatus Contubernalis sp.]
MSGWVCLPLALSCAFLPYLRCALAHISARVVGRYQFLFLIAYQKPFFIALLNSGR